MSVAQLKLALASRIQKLLEEHGFGSAFEEVADTICALSPDQSQDGTAFVVVDGLGDLAPGILLVSVKDD